MENGQGLPPLRVAVIGAGGMGTRHTNCWRRLPGAQVVAIADVQPEKAKRLADSAGLTDAAAVYPSADALLADLGSAAADVVSLCTPTPLHRPIAEAALRAGMHVFCEKPLALTAADCDAMIAAAKTAGRLLSVGQVVRFFPEYANAKRLVDAGAVGTPAAVRLRRGGDFPRATNDWYADVSQSGGVIFDLLIHDIDWVQWCFGPICRVYAQGLTERLAEGRLDHKDYALLTCRHTSGVVSHLEGTWSDPGGFVTTFEVAGDGGLLTHDSRRTAPIRKAVRAEGETKPGVAVPSSPLAPEDDPYYRQIAAFAAAVRGIAPLAVMPEEARSAVAVAAAARESLRTGKAVEMNTVD